MLNFAGAHKAMSCVIAIARQAIWNVSRSGEECAHDEAVRLEQVNLAERQLQTLLAERGEAGFVSIMHKDVWHFFCGQVSVASCSGSCRHQLACQLVLQFVSVTVFVSL